MTDAPDARLLEQFVWNGSEDAFAVLVQRHIGLVHSVALRHTANPQHAEDITQAVFTILARKAESLGRKMVLPGWLYHTARLVSANWQRAEARRVRREQEAFMQSTLEEPAADALWQALRPQLDEAMAVLAAGERDALVLRYFQNKSMAEVGQLLGLAENTAQKRVGRALEKLRKFFARRGVDSTSGSIAETISTHSVQPVSVALAKSVTAMALAKGATASTSTLTLIKGALKLMAWTKAKTAIVVGVAAIAAIGTTTVALKTVEHFNSARLESYFTRMDSSYLDTAPPVTLVRPSKYAGRGDYVIAGMGGDKLMRRGCSFAEILQTAYGFGREQMILPPNLPRGQFDMLMTASNPKEALQAELKKEFGVVAHPETRDTDVLVLKCVNPNAPGLKVSAGGGPNIWTENGSIKLQGYKISDSSGFDIKHLISSFYNLPVVDETGLTGSYDIDIHWDPNLQGNDLRKKIQSIMREQFGLEVTPTNMPIEMLVVNRQNP